MNTPPLLKHLEALTVAQATERARRTQQHARRGTHGALLAVRLLAVTPCGDEEPETEIVAECADWREAVAQGAARIFARARLDTVGAVVLVAEGSARALDDEARRFEVSLAVAVTLGPCPFFAYATVNAETLEVLEEGADIVKGSPIVALLEQVALSAEVLRGARRALGIDGDE